MTKDEAEAEDGGDHQMDTKRGVERNRQNRVYAEVIKRYEQLNMGRTMLSVVVFEGLAVDSRRIKGKAE